MLPSEWDLSNRSCSCISAKLLSWGPKSSLTLYINTVTTSPSGHERCVGINFLLKALNLFLTVCSDRPPSTCLEISAHLFPYLLTERRSIQSSRGVHFSFLIPGIKQLFHNQRQEAGLLKQEPSEMRQRSIATSLQTYGASLVARTFWRSSLSVSSQQERKIDGFCLIRSSSQLRNTMSFSGKQLVKSCKPYGP